MALKVDLIVRFQQIWSELYFVHKPPVALLVGISRNKVSASEVVLVENKL